MVRSSFREDWMYGEVGRKARRIDLPHDAMQEQGREADALTGKGGAYFRGGIYEYKKTFYAKEEWREMDVILEFEGIYPSAEIYLNEEMIGSCVYGYSGYHFHLEKLQYGKENELKVRVDAHQVPNSRWYSGTGIYRPVWLWLGGKEHICTKGIKVTTLGIDPARVMVETTHTAKAGSDVQIQVRLIRDGETIAEGCGEKLILEIPDAKLWNAESPYLYECEVFLSRDKKVIDMQKTRFGIRTLEWSTNGFFVNGKKELLRGGCIHHDNGILGSRSYEESEWRRIRRLKDFGFNAVRSAHNPACISLLEACDALGMYVMDEGWDMWYKPKTEHDYARVFEEHYQEDIQKMIAKDYNHPSVIMYSIGNEVTEPYEERGVELGKRLVQLFHENDPTRPVTAGINITLLYMASMGIDLTGNTSDEGRENDEVHSAVPAASDMNSTAYNEMVSGMGTKMNMAALLEDADKVSSPILDALDIAGYNYATSRYEVEGEKHADRIVVGSETYPQDLAKNWKLIEEHSYLIGDFMWAAWDYLGEVGIGAWTWEKDGIGFQKNYPWLLADTGAFDILGNDNAEAGNASVVWGTRKTPYIGVVPVNHGGVEPAKAIWRGTNAIPYWSYSGCEGSPAQVEVYSIGHVVELFLNEESLGRQELDECKAVFQTTYCPGVLKAVAYREDGTYLSESILKSADEHTGIRISAEQVINANEILYVNIDLTGQNGEIQCNQDTCLQISAEGAEILAFGSANPRTEESYLDAEYTTFYGRSQAVIKKTQEEAILFVCGKGLEPVSAIL